jgi:hypothetical protein
MNFVSIIGERFGNLLEPRHVVAAPLVSEELDE